MFRDTWRSSGQDAQMANVYNIVLISYEKNIMAIWQVRVISCTSRNIIKLDPFNMENPIKILCQLFTRVLANGIKYKVMNHNCGRWWRKYTKVNYIRILRMRVIRKALHAFNKTRVIFTEMNTSQMTDMKDLHAENHWTSEGNISPMWMWRWPQIIFSFTDSQT